MSSELKDSTEWMQYFFLTADLRFYLIINETVISALNYIKYFLCKQKL